MKTTRTIVLMLMVILSTQSMGQTNNTTTGGSQKNEQWALSNEVYGGYGAGSIFYFTGRMKHTGEYPTELSYYNGRYLTNIDFNTPASAGTFFLGYDRSLNKVISMGCMFGYQNFSYNGTASYSNIYGSPVDSSLIKLSSNDMLLTVIARLQFSYVNKPSIRMYSGIGIGITVNFGKGTIGEKESTERRLWPAGQLTLMGLRFGRALGGFFEFGFGSYGIINAGISYKFKD